jgi:transposase
MLSLSDQTQVYLARDPVDMRNQIDGLVLIVQEAFDLDPFAPALFAFCNRQRDKVKILYWHKIGFCLLYRRLERGRFQ